MGLSVTREGGGFQKVVFESVIDTLAGGVIVDTTGYTAAVDGYIPEGTLIGRDTLTGVGKIVADPAAPGENIKVVGLSYRDVKMEANAFVGVVIEGVARIAALPANEKTIAAAISTALPKLTLV